MADEQVIRKLPAVEVRVESGPVQFGNDWPGLFVRGDNAFHFAMALEQYMSGKYDFLTEQTVKGLLSDLRSCRV